jgi:WD40 repeat protein
VIRRQRLMLLLASFALASNSPAQGEQPVTNEKQKPADARKVVRTDLYGDALPKGAIARLGTIRLRHDESDHIASIALSPDGKMIASGGSEGNFAGQVGEKPFRIRLWDAATGKELRRFGGHTICVESVAFSPDGKSLASADDTVRLWDVATGTLHWKADMRAERVLFAPGGKALAAADREGQIHLLEAATGRPLRTLPAHGSSTAALAFSPDGKTLASGVEDVFLRDVSTGKELRRWERKGVFALAFAPDGKAVAACSSGRSVRLSEVAGGRELPFENQEERATGPLVFSPDSKQVAAVGEDGNVLLWDAVTGKKGRGLRLERGRIKAVAFTPEGNLLALGHEEAAICLWDVTTGKQCLGLPAHTGWVESVSYSPDGKTVASGSRDGTIRLWDAAASREDRLLCRLDCTICNVVFSPDGRLLASGSADGTVRLWDIAGSKELRRFRLGRKTASEKFSVAFTPDGKSLAAGDKGDVVFWDVSSGQVVRKIAAGGQNAVSVAFSPDGKVLASAGGSPTVGLRDVALGILKKELRGDREYRVSALAFSADAKVLAAAGQDAPISVWDVSRGEELSQFTRLGREGRGPSFRGTEVAFSPDGRLLAAAGWAHAVDVREVLTGAQVRDFDSSGEGMQQPVVALAFAPDGRSLASGGGGDCSIIIWDMTGLIGERELPSPALRPEVLEKLWSDLGSIDAAQANDAVWRLVADSKHAVPFLAERLRPITVGDALRLERLLKDLDSETFTVREKATEELAALREIAEPALRRAFRGNPTAEVRRRLQNLLDELEPLSAPSLLTIRVVAVLERSGGRDALRLLELLAKGAAAARLTQEARAVLERLSMQAAKR